MPDYRRIRIPGGCFFFTVNLLARHGNDLPTRRINLLRDAVRRVRRVRPFEISDWPYSTFKTSVRRGLYPPEWAGCDDGGIAAGEPGA